MNAIAAADRNWAIGKDGGMLYRLPLDLKYFAGKTKGKVLVMGRATLDSFPGGKPLPNRHHIVLSRNLEFARDGVQVVSSVQALSQAISEYRPEDVMLLGGDSVYRLLIDCCELAYVTRVDARAPADSFFPNLDTRRHWQLVSCEDPALDNGYLIRFCVYRNHRVRGLDELEP
jgi:dihydrofolate reductase